MADTQGTSQLIAALTGGDAIENAAYQDSALRLLQAQNLQAQRDKRIIDANMASQQGSSLERLPKVMRAAITNMDPDQTTFGRNQMAAILPELLVSGRGSATDFDTMMKSMSRIAMERGATDAGLTPMNVASQTFGMGAVPKVEKIGDLMVEGNLTDSPVINALLTGANAQVAGATEGAARGTQTDREIQSLVEQGVPEPRAQNIAYGNERIEIVPQTGKARIINMVTGEVDEIKLGGDNPTEIIRPAEGRTFYELANYGTGLSNSAQDLIARGVTLFGTDADMTATDAIQTINTGLREMIRALSINPKFPVAEMNAIMEEIKIKPGWMTSPQVMQTRMKSVARSLTDRMRRAEADGNNPNLPLDVQEAQASNAVMIRNFLPQLGVPGYGGVSAGESSAGLQGLDIDNMSDEEAIRMAEEAGLLR